MSYRHRYQPFLAVSTGSDEGAFEILAKVINSAHPKPPRSNATSTDVTPIPTPDTSRPTTPIPGHILSSRAGPKGTSRRARKAVGTPVNVSSGDEDLKRPKPTKTRSKKPRRWDADGLVDEDDGVTLDYSATNPDVNGVEASKSAPISGVENVDLDSVGTRTGKGEFILKDLDNEVHSILAGANAQKSKSTSTTSGVVGSSLSAITGLFRNVVGGKVLTKEDLDKSMKGMETHLLNKNVAREAAVRLCEGVERELIGVKTGSFESRLSLYSINLLM